MRERQAVAGASWCDARRVRVREVGIGVSAGVGVRVRESSRPWA